MPLRQSKIQNIGGLARTSAAKRKEAPAMAIAGASKCPSEGQVTVVFAGVCGLARRLGTPEELHVVGDDLIAVAIDSVLVGPLAVVDPAPDRDQHALGRVLGDDSPEAVEAGHPVPFGVLRGEAAFVLEGLALAVALGPAGPEAEAGDVGAAAGRAKLGIAAKVADEKNDVGQDSLS